jgi:hypothetical protein
MSETPTDEPAAPPAAQPEPDPGPAHRIDQLTAVLLLTAVGTAIAAAGPSILRMAGAPLPAAQPTAAAPPLDLRHQPPELLAHPDPLFDPDRDSDPDEASGLGMRPADPATGDHARPGQARGALALRERPADGARPVGEVKAGEIVMIVREAGDWALVWAGGNDGIVMGWVRKSGIAVR